MMVNGLVSFCRLLLIVILTLFYSVFTIRGPSVSPVCGPSMNDNVPNTRTYARSSDYIWGRQILRVLG